MKRADGGPDPTSGARRPLVFISDTEFLVPRESNTVAMRVCSCCRRGSPHLCFELREMPV